jgi:outer membrane protein TolC
VHERNRNASTALQLLLRIAAAENAADSLRRQLAEIKDTLADLKRLQIAGLDQPLSPPQTEAQHSEAEHKLAETELTIDQLNEQLAMLLGGELPPGSRYWPDVNLQVNPAIPLLEEAQSLAIIQRADLAALRVAASSSPRETTTAVRAILGPAAGVGLSAAPCRLLSLLHFRAAADEATTRSDQLHSSIADKQQSIRHEVAQALLTIDTRLNQIALSQRRTESLRLHQDNLQRTSAGVAGASFEIRRARLAVLAAEQDVFHDVIEWKIAAVKLREALGELAIDCGYTDALFANNCCQ